MKLINSIANSAYAVFLTILISIPWGAAIGALLSLFNDDRSSKWYDLAIGGALLAPMLAIIFESPMQRLVVLVSRLPYVGLLFLPFALLRFIFSVVPAMIAVRIVASEPKEMLLVVLCPYEGIVRIHTDEKVEIAKKIYVNNDIVFEIQDDWSVRQNNLPWGRISDDGRLLIAESGDASLSSNSPQLRIHEQKLFLDQKAVGALTPR